MEEFSWLQLTLALEGKYLPRMSFLDYQNFHETFIAFLLISAQVLGKKITEQTLTEVNQ